MSTISIFCLLLFFILFISLFRKHADVFAPGRLFSLIWSLAIGLTELKLSRRQIVWSDYSWLVLIVSVFSVLLGMFVVYVMMYGKPVVTVPKIRSAITKNSINSKLLLKVILILFLIYSISYIVIYLVLGYVPLFTANPSETRTKWSLFGFGLIVHYAPLIIYFIVLFYLFVRKKIIVKLFLTIVLLITFFSFLLLLSRFDLVISIVLSVVFLFYGTNKFKIKYLIVFTILLIALMYSVSTIRSSRFFIDYLYYSAKMKYSSQYAFLTEPYMYFVMNLENFANAVDKLSTFYYGYFSFDFVFALSGLKHWISDYTYIKDYPYIVNSSYNTYTMFFAYYRDFGILGVFIIPFFLGYAMSYVYYKARINPNIHTVSVYGMLVFVSIFSFFIPMLSWLHFVLNLSTIYLCTKMLVVRTKNA